MPNLAGLFDMTKPGVDIGAVLSRIARVLDVPGVEYWTRSWHDEQFGAVNVLHGICGNLEQPACTDDVVLFLDGEVDDLDGSEGGAQSGTGAAVTGPAGRCLELFLRHGDDFVRDLSGQFNVLVYDRRASSVRVFNDRLAYRPFHYCMAGGRALFGLERKAIFASMERTPAFDPMGVLQFLAMGHCLDDRTLFDSLKVMPQGSILEFRDGRASLRKYWRPSYRQNTSRVTAGHSAAEFGRRLCRAAERKARPERKYAIFLSGGLDSRAAGAALARTRNRVESFTFGPDNSPDLAYGRMLSERLGFSFNRLEYRQVEFAALLPRIVWRTEGAVPFNVPLSIAHHGAIAQKAAVVFNGHFGDVLTGGHMLPGQFLARDHRQLAVHILEKRSILRRPALERIFRRAFLDDAYDTMVEDIERSLKAMQEDRLPLTYNLWDMTVRQARFTFSSPAVDRYVLETVTPFTDNDVVEWLLSVPMSHLIGQRVYKRMILETFPQIASVPWARTGRPISANVALDLAVLGKIFIGRRMQKRRAPVADRDPRLQGLGEHAKRDEVIDLLPPALFDPDALRSAAVQASNGTGSAAPLFGLLTIAECARLFGGGVAGEAPRETWPVL